MRRFWSVFLITASSLFAFESTNTLSSTPQVLFEYDSLQKDQEKLRLQVDFNKGVLFLNQGKYEKAIESFEKSAKILKVPSFLNIAIAYYKIGSHFNAKLYLERIYELQEAKFTHTYSYMSACYYLYEITQNFDYLDEIASIASDQQTLSEEAKRLIADTFLIRKEYKRAIDILDQMEFADKFKKAIAYIMDQNFIKAEVLLEQSLQESINPQRKDRILWVMVYRDLKTNQLDKLTDKLDQISSLKRDFTANRTMPLKMYFNENKYTPAQYLEQITRFEKERVMDILFYFAPFIFSDVDEIFYDASKGFIFSRAQSVQSLEQMVQYNAKFLDVIKDDPILKVDQLKKQVTPNSKSYVYYNLGLSLAQVSDFHGAYKYFLQAFNKNPGNKLYAAMALMAAKRVNISVSNEEYLQQSILSLGGMYSYFAKNIYKLAISPSLNSALKKPHSRYKKSIFYKAIEFLKTSKQGIDKKSALIQEHQKDPLVNLITLAARDKTESEYEYKSRLQDSIPLVFNDNFLSAPVAITEYYVDFLKALGLFSKADLYMPNNTDPSYLRTKALRLIHEEKPLEAIKILENLQKKYQLTDTRTLYMIVAAYLKAGRYNDASLQITLIKNLIGDKNADFLTGVQLIQELKLGSAKQSMLYPYKDSLIDFKLEGLQQYLLSL